MMMMIVYQWRLPQEDEKLQVGHNCLNGNNCTQHCCKLGERPGLCGPSTYSYVPTYTLANLWVINQVKVYIYKKIIIVAIEINMHAFGLFIYT